MEIDSGGLTMFAFCSVPVQMSKCRRHQSPSEQTASCTALPVSQMQQETSELYAMSFKAFYLGFDAHCFEVAGVLSCVRPELLSVALLGFRHGSGYRIQLLELQWLEWGVRSTV